MTNTIKTVEELREALEEVKTAEQAESVLNSTVIQTLKKYVRKENYYFDQPISNLKKADIVDALKGDYEPNESKSEIETKINEAVSRQDEVLSNRYIMANTTEDDLVNIAHKEADVIFEISTLEELKKYFTAKGYKVCGDINTASKEDFIFWLSPAIEDEIFARLSEDFEMLKDISEAIKAEAEPTLKELEQETGFTFFRRLGQEFLSGEKSLEQLNSQIESLKRSMKYGDNSGSLHGLAYAFGIIIEGKSCEELMSEIEEFIKNREFKALSPIDKLNGIIEGKYSTEAITRLIWECERHEFIRLLNMDEQELIQKNRENHYCATDNDYIEDRIIRELERRTFRHEPVIAPEDLPEISEEAYKKASDEEYRYRVEERKLRSEYSQLQFDVHSMRKQWLGLCEVIRKSEIKATRHLGGFEDLKYKVRMQYREIRLRSLRLYREIKRVIRLCNEQKSLCKAIENQLKKCAVKKTELFNLNDNSCLTADYKGYQQVLAHDKAVIEQCQTSEEIQAKLLTVDKGSIVGIAHACGMIEPIRNYKKITQSELAEICAQKIFQARTISHAI